MNKNWQGEYSADGGAIRVYTPDVAIQFVNEVGDGTFTVSVVFDGGNIGPKNTRFLGSLIVRKSATISGYDCAYEPIYTFPQGRYGVFTDLDGNFIFHYWDELGVED